MKKNIFLMTAPVVILLLLIVSGYKLHSTAEETDNTPYHTTAATYTVPPAETDGDKWVAKPDKRTKRKDLHAEDDMIAYALSLIGTPYVYAGKSPLGFDCSGFVSHVFDQFTVKVPPSSALQAHEGVKVAKHEAAPGDIVVFTGTDASKREPGHVGIVISAPGDTISFVHSSSNGGVKVSKVQGTGYDIRFLEVRRVL